MHPLWRKSMCRLLFTVCVISVGLWSIADAKPIRTPLEPERPSGIRDLTGVYSLAHKGSPDAGIVQLKIWNQKGKTFSIGIDIVTGNRGVDWEGRGVIEGERGYYDWTFPDGKSGRTTFLVDKNGHIHGEVRGGGI